MFLHQTILTEDSSVVFLETEVIEEYGVVVPGQWIDTVDTRYNAVTGQLEPYQTQEYLPSVHGVTGYRSETTTWYDRNLVFRMFDRARSTETALYPAYEATVTSSGSTPSFAGVSTCLFSMLFQNFLQPGTEDASILSETCLR